MGIPRITEDCCSAVVEACTRTMPAEFGQEFCDQMEEEQPELFAMMSSVQCGLLVGDIENEDDLERAGEEAGRSLLLVAFVWKAVTAQLEAKEMEED